MSEGKRSKKTVVSLIWNFFGYTTAHGFARISESKTKPHRALWSLVVTAAFVVFFIQIYSLFVTFISRPIGTQISMKHETSIDFPSVSFCNLNIVRKSKISSELHSSFENFIKHNDSSPTLRRKRRSTEDPICFNYLYCKWKYHKEIVNESITTKSPTTTPLPTTTAKPTTTPTTPRPTTTQAPKTSEATTTEAPTGPTERVLTKEEKEEAAFSGSLSQPDPSTLTKETRQTEELSVNLASQPEDLMIETGHQFSDMVLSCTYRGISCTNYTEKLWSHFWHYKYGNCYVFNSGKDSQGVAKPILKSNKPGPTNGLILELNIEQNEYLGQLTQDAGMRVLISKHGEFPSPLEKGFSVSPGYSTSVGIRQTHIIREDPFNNKSCLREDDIDPDNLYRIRYNVTYSATACKDSCLAHRQLQSCGCLEYRFPSQGKQVCDIFDLSVIACLNKVQLLYQENKLGCSEKCRPPCVEDIYRLTISSSRWPSENYLSQFLEKLQQERALVLDDGENPRAYFVKFQLFYEELNYEIIQEYLSYEMVNFISDIGGQLGLWIGISCLTATEFIELVLLITARIFHNIVHGDINDSTEDSETSEAIGAQEHGIKKRQLEGSTSSCYSYTIENYDPRLINVDLPPPSPPLASQDSEISEASSDQEHHLKERQHQESYCSCYSYTIENYDPRLINLDFPPPSTTIGSQFSHCHPTAPPPPPPHYRPLRPPLTPPPPPKVSQARPDSY